MKQKHVNNPTHQKELVSTEQTRYSILGRKVLIMKKFLSLVGVSLIMTGCASFSGVENAKNIAKLKYGMSEKQVLSILGTPDSVVRTSAIEDQWIYEFKKEDKQGQNMFTLFSDGKLVKTGKLNGREIAEANENRTPGVCTHRLPAEIQQESLCIK